ncbi:MAG: rod shape-determining protein MreC [Lentimonas sp.]|jgi:rod shape-determining protein MreC
MANNFLEQRNHHSNFFCYHNIRAAFLEIENIFFIIICLLLIGTSKLNHKITDNISMAVAKSAMPISKAASAPINSVANLVINFQELTSARKQNSRLIEENQKLKSLYIQSLNISEENKHLKNILKYLSIRSSKFTVTHLISSSQKSYSNNAFIAVGENKDIRENDIVVGENAMIGRITQISPDKSRILLVSDINSRIPIIIAGSGIKGVLAGDNGDTMEILYLGKNHPAKVGDMVFTSGDDNSIPPGYLVGIITKVGKYKAYAKMAENVRNLNIVGVVHYQIPIDKDSSQ